MSLDDIEALCVSDHSGETNRRSEIWEGLMRFKSELDDLGISYEMWIDGSFLTEKPMPGDVDVAIELDPVEVDQLSPNAIRELMRLLGPTREAKLRYNTDAYYFMKNDPKTRSYWRGWFCFTRDENPKGIARIYSS